MSEKVFSLLCWNIRGFQSANGSKIAGFIKRQDADIVCLQENVNLVDLGLADYVKPSECCAETVYPDFVWNATGVNLPEEMADQVFLCNTIFVKKSLQHLVTGKKEFTFSADSGSERSVCAIEIAGIRIANTHLCGGRHDDQHFGRLVEEKRKQVYQIVEKIDPDIIVGDLNSESCVNEAVNTLRTYPLYYNLSTTAEKEQFLLYYLSAHAYLQTSGYIKAFDEEQVRPTSAFGGVPDWIYVRKGKGVSIEDVVKVNAIPHLSDHNAILCTIKCN